MRNMTIVYSHIKRTLIVILFGVFFLGHHAFASEVTGTLNSSGAATQGNTVIPTQKPTTTDQHVFNGNTNKGQTDPRVMNDNTQKAPAVTVTDMGTGDVAQNAQNQSQLASALALLAAGNVVAWLWLLVVLAVLIAAISYIFSRRIEERYDPDTVDTYR